MADAFFQAAFCQPPIVLGRRLRPFSLSHSYLLAGLENPCLVTGAGLVADLCAAVSICSHGHAENAQRLFNGGPSFDRERREFAKALRVEGEASARAAFDVYLADFCHIPEHWRDEAESGSTFRAPWQFHFVFVLCRDYHMTPEQAWDTPVALARCYYDVMAEVGGDKSLVTAREQALIEQARAG